MASNPTNKNTTMEKDPTQEELDAMREAEDDLNYFDDEPEDVIIGYHCIACGHTQASNSWGGECNVCCCNSLDPIYE